MRAARRRDGTGLAELKARYPTTEVTCVLRARLERQVPLKGMRWGEFGVTTMRNAVAVQGVADRVGAETLFTNEYLDLANAVDVAVVRALAGRVQPSGRR